MREIPFNPTKTELHVILNESFASLMGICLLIERGQYSHEKLKQVRSFMTGLIDNSEIPS